jgi:hypothetical protein
VSQGAPGYHSMSPDRAPMSPPPENDPCLEAMGDTPRFKFVAKAEIEVHIPPNVTVMQFGYGDTRRVRFVVEYDAEHPELADGFLRNTILELGSLLLEART